MNYDMQPIVDVMDNAITKLNKIMKKTPQRVNIRRYLEAGGKLTPKAARNFWGCDRLASRIWDIQQEYNFKYDYRVDLTTSRKEIDKTMVRTISGAWVAQYFLKKLA